MKPITNQKAHYQLSHLQITNFVPKVYQVLSRIKQVAKPHSTLAKL